MANNHDRIAAMKALTAKYTQNLPSPTTSPHDQRPTTNTPKTILLTGSTGSIGSHLLASLLARPGSEVAHIYCLNRVSPTTTPTITGTTTNTPTHPTLTGASSAPNSTATIPSHPALLRRQLSISASRALPTNFPPQRITFLSADLSNPTFSLPGPVYNHLRQVVTHIIHNAWPVNFLAPLDYFEPQLAGIRNLVEFCVGSGRIAGRIAGKGVVLGFTSTVGVGMNPMARWSGGKGGELGERVLGGVGGVGGEEVVRGEGDQDDWDKPLPTGYAEAKFVSERILVEASQRSGVSVRVLRLGQIAGAVGNSGDGVSGNHGGRRGDLGEVGGEWNRGEWFPSMLRSSVFLGAVPGELGGSGEVRWVPVDVCAEVICELLLEADNGRVGGEVEDWIADYVGDSELEDRERVGRCQVFHISNPRPTTYAALLPTILAHMPPTIRKVSYAEWVALLENSTEDKERNPALRLLDIFQGMRLMSQMGKRLIGLETTETVKRSRRLRRLEAVRPEWMGVWMRQWGFRGGDRAVL